MQWIESLPVALATGDGSEILQIGSARVTEVQPIDNKEIACTSPITILQGLEPCK